jgi:hypothetical protein
MANAMNRVAFEDVGGARSRNQTRVVFEDAGGHAMARPY